MPTKIMKRFQVPAREFHLLLRETLVYALGWGDVDVSSLAIFEAPLATGVDGETLAAQPNRFRSGSAPFLPAMVGQYLTVYGSEFVNNGVYRIVGVPSADEVVLEGGLYGANFVDDINVQFRVVDPTLNAAGTNHFIVQGLAGSATPLWQTRIFVTAAVNDTIEFEVGPQGGWLAGWTLPILVPQAVQADATQTWYALIEDTHIRLFTQNAAGSAPFEIGYLGAAEPRRTGDDTRFVIAFGGSPALSAAGALAAVSAVDQSFATQVAYSALTYGDSVQQNMFMALPDSVFDLRRDSARIPVGTEQAGFEEDDRGYVRGFRYIADSIPYRSFVDNGRLVLSLGNGLAIDWDGSLSR